MFKTTKNRKCDLRKAALKKEDVEKKLKKKRFKYN
jgi:hypothetical protein